MTHFGSENEKGVTLGQVVRDVYGGYIFVRSIFCF